MVTGRFEDRYAVITGGTQGLGEAATSLMLERGLAGAIIVGRDEVKGQQTAERLGDRVRFEQGDIADPEVCKRVIGRAEAEFGALHVVANCAAATFRGDVWNTTVDMWDTMIDTNLRAPFLLTQAAADLMERTGSDGSIVLIGSVAAEGGAPRLLPYSVAKGGLQALTRNAAYSLARHHIRVNLLQLGWMNTPAEHTVQMNDEGQPADWLEAAAASQPFGRLIEVDEAARAICYLASDESGLMTGATIDFDQSIVGAGDQPVPGPEVRRT